MSQYNYDENAQFFPYFILTFLALLLFPATYRLFVPPAGSHLNPPTCSCSTCSKKYSSLKLAATSFKLTKKYRPPAMLLTPRMVLLTAGWALFGYMAYLIATVKIESIFWDPYKILGISLSATPQQIRSHYKRASLKLYRPLAHIH
ncbi:Translocation protein sec63 [Neolecta irregularis DAH-3]|uniref:Translocation protein sec63 n=1 Tax=Neolecta irregularis (strain DAH-3) TaxID=1198029 RepID=A0A1U7LV69_NEOID|nr:Translocation protein sec63 [Neolecta irregularis DAH-3]|eukprot:OLL26570.1 Translocation protein sec63 [Neolecta irregularis DAH-3]